MTRAKHTAQTQKEFSFIAWFGLLLFTACSFLSIVSHSSGFIQIASLLFSYFFLFLLWHTLGRYEWDDETISVRKLFRTTTLRWDEITDYKMYRAGELKYVLIASGPEKLKVNIQNVGIDGPLHRAVECHIAPLREKKLESLLASGTAVFMKRNLLSRTLIILTPDTIVHRTNRKEEILPLHEIRYVFLENRNFIYLKHDEVKRNQKFDSLMKYVLNDGTRDRLSLDSGIADSDLLFQLLERWVPGAAWIDMCKPAPHEHHVQRAYFRHRLAAIQKQLKLMSILDASLAGVLLLLAALPWEGAYHWGRNGVNWMVLFLMGGFNLLNLLFRERECSKVIDQIENEYAS